MAASRRMAKYLVFSVLIIAGLASNNGQNAARAGFEWLPDGERKYTDTPKKEQYIETITPQGTTVPSSRGQSVSGDFLPMPGQTQTPPMQAPQQSPQRLSPAPKVNMGYMDQSIQTMHENTTGSYVSPTVKPYSTYGGIDNSYTSNNTYEVVAGFGSDIPLALALRQIVPPAYAFSFGQGVNPGYRVSWNGGKPWNLVVHDMISPLGFSAYVQGKKLHIVKSGRTAAGGTPLETSSSPAPSYQTQGMAPVSNTQSGSVPMPASAIMPQKLTYAPVPSMPDVPNPPPLGADGRRDTIIDPGQHTRPQPAQTLARIKKLVSLDNLDNKVKVTDIRANANTAIDSPIRRYEPKPLLPAEVAEKFTYQSDVEDDTYNKNLGENVMLWEANQGDSLKNTLDKWADQVGVKVVWQASQDFLVTGDVFINGTFRDALKTMMTEGLSTQNRPTMKFYETPNGPQLAMLIINDP